MAEITPTLAVQWANAALPGDVVYPISGVEASGYLDGEPLPHEEFNGIIQRLGEWTVWLLDLASGPSGSGNSASLAFGSAFGSTFGMSTDAANLCVMRAKGPLGGSSLLDANAVFLRGTTATAGLPEFTIMTTGSNGAVLVRTVDNVNLTELTWARDGAGVARLTADTLRSNLTDVRQLQFYTPAFDPADNVAEVIPDVVSISGAVLLDITSPAALQTVVKSDAVHVGRFGPGGDAIRISGGSGENLALNYSVGTIPNTNALTLVGSGANTSVLRTDNLFLDGVVHFPPASSLTPLDPTTGASRAAMVTRRNVCRAKLILEFEENGSNEYGPATFFSAKSWNVASVSVDLVTTGVITIDLIDPALDPVIAATAGTNIPASFDMVNVLDYDDTGAVVKLLPVSLPFGAAPQLAIELIRKDVPTGKKLQICVTVH